MDSLNTSQIEGQDAELAEIVPISDIQKQFEDELFKQAQDRNVDYVPPVDRKTITDNAVKAMQAYDEAITKVEQSSTTLHILDAAYDEYRWSKDNPDEFQENLDRHRITVRSDAGAAVPIFRYFEKVSGTKKARQNYTSWSKVLDYAYRKDWEIGDFLPKVKSFPRLKDITDGYDRQFGDPEKAAARIEKKRAEEKRISFLEQEVPTISALPERKGIPMCAGTSGLGLLLYREGVDGEDGILCRLSVTVEDVEKLVHKHQGTLNDGQVEDILACLKGDVDEAEEVGDAA